MLISHTFDLHCELTDWFLYDENIKHNCVNLLQLSVVILHRNQALDLQRKLNNWFLYEVQRWAEMG